jgi:hypothetical protein
MQLCVFARLAGFYSILVAGDGFLWHTSGVGMRLGGSDAELGGRGRCVTGGWPSR